MDEHVIDSRRVITSMGYRTHAQLTFSENEITHDTLHAQDGSYESLPHARRQRVWAMKLSDDIEVKPILSRKRSFKVSNIEKIIYDLGGCLNTGIYGCRYTKASVFVMLKTDADPKPLFDLHLNINPEERWKEATSAPTEKVLEAIEERYGIPFERQDYIDCKARRLNWRKLLIYSLICLTFLCLMFW